MNTNWNFMIKTSAIFLIILLFKKNCLVLAADEEANANMSNDSNDSQKGADPESNDGYNVAKRAWKQLQAGWGKRDDTSEGDYQMIRNYFQNLPAEDYNDRNFDYESNYLTPAKLRIGNANADEDITENVEKRAWKQMNAAWGKRVNDWNKFRGAWGKREQMAGWNNLRGLWGKRSKNWSKLNSSWGKRNSPNDNLY